MSNNEKRRRENILNAFTEMYFILCAKAFVGDDSFL